MEEKCYSRACDHCRNLKVKCTKIKPACNRCVKKGIPCTRDNPIQKRGPKPKPSLTLYATNTCDEILPITNYHQLNLSLTNHRLKSNISPTLNTSLNSTTSTSSNYSEHSPIKEDQIEDQISFKMSSENELMNSNTSYYTTTVLNPNQNSSSPHVLTPTFEDFQVETPNELFIYYFKNIHSYIPLIDISGPIPTNLFPYIQYLTRAHKYDSYTFHFALLQFLANLNLDPYMNINSNLASDVLLKLTLFIKTYGL